MNEILGLAGTLAICGCFYLMARSEKQTNERLQNRINKLEIEGHDLWNENLSKKKIIKELKKDIRKLDYTIELKEEIIKNQKVVIGKRDKEIEELCKTIIKKNNYLDAKQDIIRAYACKIKKQGNEIKELGETIMFDNNVMIQKTEMNEFMENKIVKLDSESEAKTSEILYLRRKLKRVRASRLKKVIKAEKLIQ